MSNTILSGDLTVYYLAENRRKQIRWTGGALKSNVQKLVSIYDAVQDLFTLSTQMDDGIIFSGETPAEYTIGKIDAGEIDPWFIDLETMEHIIGDYKNFTGCALKTSGWKRDLPGDGTGNTGIVVVPVSSGGTIVQGDIGQDITHADLDAGTLLDIIITGGSTDYLFIRPDSNALANDWDSTSGTITEAGLSHTATQSAAAVTGEMIWGNVYTQGALDADTHIYLFQNGIKITANDKTAEDWWINGHMDRSVAITDYTTANFPIIDSGWLTVYARQYTFAYSYAQIRMNTTTGGAVSAGLSSGVDINNTTGHKRILTGAWTGTFTVGEEFYDTSTDTKQGIITAVVTNTSIDYYPIGDPITPFVASDPITGRDSAATATMTAAGPTDQGPANLTLDPVLTFANTQVDIDDTGGTEPYGISIDVNQNTLADLYEWLKYTCRRGSITDLDGLDGQEYIGIDYRVNYTSITGTIAEGAVVTGVTSGATGTVVSHDTTDKVALLRNSRGTFQDAEQIQVDGGNYWAASGLTVTGITPVAEMPFGTLAGGVFFGSLGVVLVDYKATEENSFILKDANGVQRVRPTTMQMIISNIKQYDWASCYRLTGSGGSINKTERACVGGEAIGDATIVTDAIATDTPGKSTGGRLLLVDVTDNNKEYAIRYDSWTTATFTLSNIVIALADAGTTTTNITETGAFTNAKVGDLVLNITQGDAISYISAIIDNDNCTISPPITGQTTNDNIEINAVPIVITSADKIYIPVILEFAAADGDITSSMVYGADIYARTRVRNTSDAVIKIKPFTSDVTITNSGGATAAVRNADPVYGA